jgi:hypothetical protein
LSGLRAQTNEIAHRVARKMVGNECAEIIGKDFFDSRCLFTRCQSTDGHDRRPRCWNTFGCDQAIGPAVWRCLKILRVLQYQHSPLLGELTVLGEHYYCLSDVGGGVRDFRDGSRRAGANEQTVFASSALNSDAMSAWPARSTVRLASHNPQGMQRACRSAEILRPLDRSHGPGHRPSVHALQASASATPEFGSTPLSLVNSPILLVARRR